MKKMYKNTTSVFHSAMVGFLVIIFTVSCVKEPIKPANNDTKNKAEYNLEINGKELIGDGADSNWDPDLGIIWLGTDENNLPTGTLTILIESVEFIPGNEQPGPYTTYDETVAYISSATLSTVDQLVGTGDEINGKTYQIVGSDELIEYYDVSKLFLSGVEIGANYISAEIYFYDDIGDFYGGLPMRETTTGELGSLIGTFTAINNN